MWLVLLLELLALSFIIGVFYILFIAAMHAKSEEWSQNSYDDGDEDNDEVSDEKYGKYVIQYRKGYGGWIDGPGSNDERIAERMFDNFVSREMLHRNATRARLVKMNRSGHVISVLGTS